MTKTEKTIDSKEKSRVAPSCADVVIVDDDRALINLLQIALSQKKIDKYYYPEACLDNAGRYDQEKTVFCIDNYFTASVMKGVDLARQLHAKGFQRLYLFTGQEIDEESVPDYLTVIKKTDTDQLMEQLNRSDEDEAACTSAAETKSADVVLIDEACDAMAYLDKTIFFDKTVDKYYKPEAFFENSEQYAKKQTLFLIDYYFSKSNLSGLGVAQRLHELGFKYLYVFSDKEFKEETIPDYVRTIKKSDTGRLITLNHHWQKTVSEVDARENELQPPSEAMSVLVEDESMMDVLLHHLSHEVLNNLSAIQINADLIKLMETGENTLTVEKKKQIIGFTENIKQSRKECEQILSMEIAKLRAAMHLPMSTKMGKVHALNDTVEQALAEYPFRQEEKSRVNYKPSKKALLYCGHIEGVKQVLFHVLKQGLKIVQEKDDGKILIYCAEGNTLHQLIIRNTAMDVASDLFLRDVDSVESHDAMSLDTKLSGIFCRSMMQALGGRIEYRVSTDNFNELVFYFAAVK